MATEDRSLAGVLRAAAKGAGFLAAVTAVGACVGLYQSITTGKPPLGEIVLGISVASFMGACGGVAYYLVNHSRIKTRWKPFLAVLAAIEAYLFAFWPPLLVIERVAPKLNEGMPADDLWLFLAAQGFGLLLCIVGFGVAYAPRLAKVILVVAAVAVILPTVAFMLVLVNIGPIRSTSGWDS